VGFQNKVVSAPTITLLLDVLDGTCLGLWSTSRKARHAYAGSCRRLYRTNDAAESNFGFSGTALAASAAESWLAGSAGKEAKEYDQSANGRDISYATAAYLWLAANAGTLYAGPNSKWSCLSTGILVLDSAVNITPATAWWFWVVAKDTESGENTYRALLSGIGDTWVLSRYSSTYKLYLQTTGHGATRIVNNAVGYGNWFLAIGCMNGASSWLEVNGTKVDGTIDQPSADKIRVGADSTPDAAWKGNYAELGIMGGTPSASDLTKLKADILSTYGISA
jgi:hypothetical protein